MMRGVPRLTIMLGATAFLAAALAGSAQAAVHAGGTGHAGRSGATRAGAVTTAAVADLGVPALMLRSSDLPAGFRPYPPLTGRLDARRARLLGGGAGQVAALLHGWVRDWYSAGTGLEVREEAFDAGTSGTARGAIRSFDSSVSARGLTEQQIAPHLSGFRSAFPVNGISYTAVTVPLARGPVFFVLSVLAPAQSSSSAVQLVTELAAAQVRRVPANTPNTGTSLSGLNPDTYDAAGYAVGFLLGYLGLVSGLAYLRNPLRRGRRQPSQAVRRWSDGQRVVDVSGRANSYRKTARLRLAVQLAGLGVAACGADPFLVTGWYIFLLAGTVIVWAGGRFIQPQGLGSARNRAALSGPHKARFVLMMSLASVMLIAGALLVMAYALNQAQPPAVLAASGSAQNLGPGFAWAGVVFVAAGAVVSRLARRLASGDARRLMLRDNRPPVLYLRSFGDDALKLWAATLGRPSLIERFTPRRFDPFEEVMARHLSQCGPVIALNPPGTKLAPLGAARETLDSDGWQSTIADWMERSALIVFVAPPGRVTPGLVWELETVSAARHWDKTLIVVPPVPERLLQDRWQAFRQACSRLWPFTLPLSVDGPGSLVLTFRNNGWTVIAADRQNEWAYSAALAEAIADPGSGISEATGVGSGDQASGRVTPHATINGGPPAI